MKEKDIVDFSKLEKDAEGKVIGHEDFRGRSDVNYVQMLARNSVFKENIKQASVNCPVCGKLVSIHYFDMQAVSEENVSIPDSEVHCWPVTQCLECFAYFAWVPTTIFYDDRDEIYYTGGKSFIIDAPEVDLYNRIIELIEPSIEQYIHRKVDKHDDTIGFNNLKIWFKNDVKKAIASWLYDNDLKK